MMRTALRLMLVALLLAGCSAGADLATASPEAEASPVASALPETQLEPGLAACSAEVTPAQTEGPYYKAGSPERSNLVEPGTAGEALLVTGVLMTPDCSPIAGARLDFWQADGNGDYDNAGFGLRGYQFTDEAGGYRLETVIPGEYPGRTPHIHVKVFAPDGGEILTTQLYLPGISDQIPDAIFDASLLARDESPDPSGRRHISFDFVVEP